MIIPVLNVSLYPYEDLWCFLTFDTAKADSPTALTVTAGKQTRSMCELDWGAGLNPPLIISIYLVLPWLQSFLKMHQSGLDNKEVVQVCTHTCLFYFQRSCCQDEDIKNCFLHFCNAVKSPYKRNSFHGMVVSSYFNHDYCERLPWHRPTHTHTQNLSPDMFFAC